VPWEEEKEDKGKGKETFQDQENKLI